MYIRRNENVLDSNDEQWDGHPGQFLAIEGKGIMGRYDVIVGPNVYSMQWQGKEINKEIRESFAEPFLKSLQLIEKPPAVTLPVDPSIDDLQVAPPAPGPAPAPMPLGCMHGEPQRLQLRQSFLAAQRKMSGEGTQKLAKPDGAPCRFKLKLKVTANGPASGGSGKHSDVQPEQANVGR